MRKYIVAVLLIVAFLGYGGIALGVTTSTDCAQTIERSVAWKINDERAANGLPPLYISDVLSASAEHMVQDFSHYAHTSSHYLHDGTIWSDNQRNHGYTYNTYRGQNTGDGQLYASTIVADWMSSPPHRANILNPNYVVIGVGQTTDEFGHPYWTADFGGYADTKADYCD